MERKVIAVRADKADRISYLKHFDYDPEELVYTTGKVTMGRYHDGNQYGEASLTIDGAQSGRADLILTGRFENRRLVDGDHFVATAGLLDTGGRPLHHMRVKRGLDARFGGLFNKKRWRGGATARSSIDSMDDVAVIALALGYRDSIDDAKTWQRIFELAKEMFAEDEKQAARQPEEAAT